MEANAEQEGIVTDPRTGLIWEKKTDTNANETYTWKEAWSYVASMNESNLYGYSDWRLPTTDELKGILVSNRQEPCIDPIFGPTASDWYWTGSTYSCHESYAYSVDFGFGDSTRDAKTVKHHVRAVRG